MSTDRMCWPVGRRAGERFPTRPRLVHGSSTARPRLVHGSSTARPRLVHGSSTARPRLTFAFAGLCCSFIVPLLVAAGRLQSCGG